MFAPMDDPGAVFSFLLLVSIGLLAVIDAYLFRPIKTSAAYSWYVRSGDRFQATANSAVRIESVGFFMVKKGDQVLDAFFKADKTGYESAFLLEKDQILEVSIAPEASEAAMSSTAPLLYWSQQQRLKQLFTRVCSALILVIGVVHFSQYL